MNGPARVVFHPEAVAEARAAFAWYSSRNGPAGQAFLTELDQAVLRSMEAPEAWPVFRGSVRRCLFERFPYSMFYRVVESEIHVIAVAHAKRRPGYWKAR